MTMLEKTPEFKQKICKAFVLSASILASSSFLSGAEEVNAQGHFSNPAVPDLPGHYKAPVYGYPILREELDGTEKDTVAAVFRYKMIISKVVIINNFKLSTPEFFEDVEGAAEGLNAKWKEEKKELGKIAKELLLEESNINKLDKLDAMWRRLCHFEKTMHDDRMVELMRQALDGSFKKPEAKDQAKEMQPEKKNFKNEKKAEPKKELKFKPWVPPGPIISTPVPV